MHSHSDPSEEEDGFLSGEVRHLWEGDHLLIYPKA